MLLNLPKYILVSFLKEWLELTAICKLDTAICSNSHRNGFVGSLGEFDLSYDNMLAEHSQMNLVSWIVKRNLNIKNLVLQERNGRKPSVESLVNNEFSTLNHLKLGCGKGYKLFLPLISKCINL